ncbi:MAG: hypothetical protein AB3N23_08590 [Paracoccaceae bacterium]
MKLTPKLAGLYGDISDTQGLIGDNDPEVTDLISELQLIGEVLENRITPDQKTELGVELEHISPMRIVASKKTCPCCGRPFD